MSLAATGISFAWPGQGTLLDGVGLSVADGEFLALVGANGSGKSTLLRILAGLLVPAAGTVELGGEEISALAADERARSLSFLPQSVRPLYPMSVRRMVELARHPWCGHHGQPDSDVVEEALRHCDALDLADRMFAELSGGERQRVLLAGALAQGGSVLLLDEPTAALDLPHAVSIFERLRGQLEPGRCALVVTHDLNLAAAWADRVLLLHGGGIIADGAPGEVFRQEVLDRALGSGIEVIKHPRTGEPRVLPRGRQASK